MKCLALAASLLACKGDGSPAIDRTRTIGSLSADERADLCGELLAVQMRRIESPARLVCNGKAQSDMDRAARTARRRDKRQLPTEELRPICTESFADCIANPEPMPSCTGMPALDCEVTIGELYECVDEAIARANEYAKQDVCEQPAIGMDGIIEVFSGPRCEPVIACFAR